MKGVGGRGATWLVACRLLSQRAFCLCKRGTPPLNLSPHLLPFSCSAQSNSVEFSVAGLSMVRGGLTIRATFSPASPQRVDIQFQEATLVSGAGATCGR